MLFTDYLGEGRKQISFVSPHDFSDSQSRQLASKSRDLNLRSSKYEEGANHLTMAFSAY